MKKSFALSFLLCVFALSGSTVFAQQYVGKIQPLSCGCSKTVGATMAQNTQQCTATFQYINLTTNPANNNLPSAGSIAQFGGGSSAFAVGTLYNFLSTKYPYYSGVGTGNSMANATSTWNHGQIRTVKLHHQGGNPAPGAFGVSFYANGRFSTTKLVYGSQISCVLP